MNVVRYGSQSPPRMVKVATAALILWIPGCFALATLLTWMASRSCAALLEPDRSQCVEGAGFAGVAAYSLLFAGLPVVVVIWFFIWWPNRVRLPTHAAEAKRVRGLSGWSCFQPSRIPSPSAMRGARAYFSTGDPFEPGQVRVWLARAPLRSGLDFQTDPASGQISIDTGLLPLFDDDQLWVCVVPQASWVVNAADPPAT